MDWLERLANSADSSLISSWRRWTSRQARCLSNWCMLPSSSATVGTWNIHAQTSPPTSDTEHALLRLTDRRVTGRPHWCKGPRETLDWQVDTSNCGERCDYRQEYQSNVKCCSLFFKSEAFSHSKSIKTGPCPTSYFRFTSLNSLNCAVEWVLKITMPSAPPHQRDSIDHHASFH